MALNKRNELDKVLKQMQRCSRVVRKLSNATVEQPDTPPGEKLGADPDQLIKALQTAIREMKPDMRPSKPQAFADETQDPNKALEAEVDKTVALTTGQGKPRSPESIAKDVLAMHWRLLESGDAMRFFLSDALQRKLAACLPNSTSLIEAEPAAMQQQLHQLRVRCAIAKGRHTVSFKGYGAATELLRLLASQNEPSIKAVLKLPQSAPTTPFEALGVASETRCEAELQLSFDVRGILIPPRETFPVSGVEPGPMMAAAALNSLLTKWDTVALEAKLPGPGCSAAAAAPSASGLLSFLPPPMVLPAGSDPGVALVLCSRAMRALHDVGKGACAVVQWAGRGGGGSAAAGGLDELQPAGFVITLAELCMNDGRGIMLKNSPSVVSEALVDNGQAEADPRHPLSRRFDAILLGVDSIMSHYGADIELAMCESYIEGFVQQTRERFGSSTMSGSTMYDGDSDDD